MAVLGRWPEAHEVKTIPGEAANNDIEPPIAVSALIYRIHNTKSPDPAGYSATREDRCQTPDICERLGAPVLTTHPAKLSRTAITRQCAAIIMNSVAIKSSDEMAALAAQISACRLHSSAVIDAASQGIVPACRVAPGEVYCS